MQALAPPTIFAQASRLNFSTRLFNLLVTNVPGPQFPLYVLGRQLQDLFPVAFLPKNHALAVAIMSYDGGMDFGLLGDYDAMPDLERLGEMLSASLAELLDAAAAARGPASNGKTEVASPKVRSPKVSSRARTSRPRTSSPATTEA
jgi:diacylglycerol O-acyltransferase / wax synthase